MQSPTSDSLFKRSLRVAPGGVHSPVRAFKSVGGRPLFFRRAEGAYLETVDGQKLIDFCQSFGPNLLGHRDPEVFEAVQAQMSLAWSFGACEPYSLDLAEWITNRIPWVEKLRFVSSGTEAVMSALRVARAATQRSKIIKFDGCYHGHVDSMLVKSGSGLAGLASSDSAGVTSEMAALTLVSPLDDEAELEALFARNSNEVAAVIVEPLPANYGLLEQRKEFLKKIFSCAREAGALVIFDEVISGFRVARGGMAEAECLVPDLVTYGKVIGGGFAVGAYGGRKDLMDLVAPSGPVYQAGTLSANPVSVVAGLATLKKMERVNVWNQLRHRTAQFCEGINQKFHQLELPLEWSHRGSLIWMKKKSAQPWRRLEHIEAGHAETFQKIFHALLNRGVYLAPSGYEVGFLSLAHTPEILEEATQAIVEAAKEVFNR